MGAFDLAIYRGNDRSFAMTVEVGGAPVDLTGATIGFMAKLRESDADADAVISLSTSDGIAIVDGPAGRLRVDVPASATEPLDPDVKLLWDLRVETADGKARTFPDPDPRQPTHGTLTVRRDITRDAP